MAVLRRVRRRDAAGFTLVELMVVVVLISVISVLATPAMRRARDDRIAFDSARRIEQLIHRTRARAPGRGAAHLFVAQPSGLRGKFLVFEALDGTLITSTPPGPNPVSTCKGVGEWVYPPVFVPGVVDNTARLIDGFDLNSTGVNVDMDLRTVYMVNNVIAPAVVICVTPGGLTYVGTGATVTLAIADMQAQPAPFSSFMEITVTRNVGGAPIGLTRRVLVAGSAAARIKSQ